MNENWKTSAIGDIVARLPKAADLFKANRIDFCCGGHRALGGVLEAQQIDEQRIYAELDKLARHQAARAGRPLAELPSAELADYIEGRHHAYLRESLPQISGLFATVLKAHGARHPELFQAHAVFGSLRTDLEQHLAREEALLFPALGQALPPETIELAGQIIAEHTAAGEALRRLRELTGGYAAPADACGTYTRLLGELEALEGDLFQHIHLENNILLKDIHEKGGGTNG